MIDRIKSPSGLVCLFVTTEDLPDATNLLASGRGTFISNPDWDLQFIGSDGPYGWDFSSLKEHDLPESMICRADGFSIFLTDSEESYRLYIQKMINREESQSAERVAKLKEAINEYR